MNKKTVITILFVLVAVSGQGQTPKDSCSIPKDSLCQERTAKSDTINCPLDKLFLLKANVTNKEESKSNFTMGESPVPNMDWKYRKETNKEYSLHCILLNPVPCGADGILGYAHDAVSDNP